MQDRINGGGVVGIGGFGRGLVLDVGDGAGDVVESLTGRRQGVGVWERFA